MVYNNICEWYKIWNGKPINSKLVNPYNFIEENGRIYFLQHEATLFGKEYYRPNEEGIDTHFVIGYLDSYNGELKVIDRFEDEYLAQVEQTIGQHAPIFGIDRGFCINRIKFLSPVVEAGDEEKISDEFDEVDETNALRIKEQDCSDDCDEFWAGWSYSYPIQKKEDEHIALLYEDDDGCKCFFTRWVRAVDKLELLCLFMEEDNRLDVIGTMDLFLGYNKEHVYYMYNNQIYCVDTQEDTVETKVLDYSILCEEHQCKDLAFYDVKTETAFFYMDSTVWDRMCSLLGKVGLIGFDSHDKIQLVEQIPVMNNQNASIVFDGTKYVERVSGNTNGYIVYRKNGSIQDRFISNSAKADGDNIFTVEDVVFFDWYEEENESDVLAYSTANGLNLVFQQDVIHDLTREYKSESLRSNKLEILDKSEIVDLRCRVLGSTDRKALNFITVMNTMIPMMIPAWEEYQAYLHELKDRIQRKMKANELVWNEMIGYAGCLDLPEEVIDEFYEGRIHLDFDSIIREGPNGLETCKVGLILSCNEKYIYSYCDYAIYRTDIESFERFQISQLVSELKDRNILFVDAAREIFYYANEELMNLVVAYESVDIIGMDIHGNNVVAFEAAGYDGDSDLNMDQDTELSLEEQIQKIRDAHVTLLFDGEKYIKLWMDHYSIG